MLSTCGITKHVFVHCFDILWYHSAGGVVALVVSPSRICVTALITGCIIVPELCHHVLSPLSDLSRGCHHADHPLYI